MRIYERDAVQCDRDRLTGCQLDPEPVVVAQGLERSADRPAYRDGSRRRRIARNVRHFALAQTPMWSFRPLSRGAPSHSDH